MRLTRFFFVALVGGIAVLSFGGCSNSTLTARAPGAAAVRKAPAVQLDSDVPVLFKALDRTRGEISEAEQRLEALRSRVDTLKDYRPK